MYSSNVWRRLRGRSVALLLAALLLALGCAHTAKNTRPPAPGAEELAELWVDPGDPSSRDVFNGPGGAVLMPAPMAQFRAVRKDTKGYSWGWDVVDEHGVEWSVKYGPEAQSEVVASRVLWAMGYHQPPSYHVEHWVMTGGDSPGRGPPARFRRHSPDMRRSGRWSFYRNPFVNTAPYRGLLVLMRVLNNWDLLDRNNAVYELDRPREGARRWYVVLDLGASLGKTMLVPSSGTRNDIEDFEEQGFIKGVDREGHVHFDDLGRRHLGLFRNLTVADVHWMCERLDRLTAEQWRETFRAAHYEPALADRFIRRIQDKVRAGLALGPDRHNAATVR
jgi:hypothetical protein